MTDRGLLFLQEYRRFMRRKRIILAVTVLASLLIALYSAGIGTVIIPFPEIIQTIIGYGEERTRVVIMGIRLPRVVTGVLAGGILAISGVVMQCVLRNRLASSSTLGVSQGAAFGAAVGIICFSGGTINSSAASAAVTLHNPYIVTICAFVGGSLSTAVVLAVSLMRKNIGPNTLILAGVALSSLFSGGSTLLQYFADETKIGAIVFWTFGSLSGAGWSEATVLLIVFVVSLLFFLCNRWNYNAMESGLDTAQSIGVNTRAVTYLSMAVCSFATSAAVSFIGIISFIGLIAPHIMRRLIGSDYRFLLLGSAAAGALLLLLADVVARTISAPIVLPIGAVTSFLGAPLFLFLLLKDSR